MAAFRRIVDRLNYSQSCDPEHRWQLANVHRNRVNRCGERQPIELGGSWTMDVVAAAVNRHVHPLGQRVHQADYRSTSYDGFVRKAVASAAVRCDRLERAAAEAVVVVAHAWHAD